MNAGPSVPTSSRAVVALVLGIIGIVLCPLTAPVAWVLGKNAEEEIDTSGGTVNGRGLATAGKITGIIGVVLLVIYVVLIIFFFVFLAVLFDNSSPSYTEPVPR